MVDKIGPAVEVDTVAVRTFGKGLADDVQPVLRKALHQLDTARGVLHSNFTAVTSRLAIAYAAAVEYTEPELTSKHEHLTTLAGTLHRVAANWEEADRKSTARVQA